MPAFPACIFWMFMWSYEEEYCTYDILPVVPRKAAAEVSKIEHYRRGESL